MTSAPGPLWLDGIVPPLLVAFSAILLFWIRRQVSIFRGWRGDLAVALCVVLVTASLELAMGRSPTYRHGPVRMWSGDINSDQNSQQVTDPYTFSHVVHGALFYGITHLAMGPASFATRAIVALTIEGAWESYENTDTVINRYRAATIALGYYGDTVLNSVADIVACLVGFVLASRLRWWWTFSWVVATEIVLAILIRDNLTLNVIMLIRPIDAIRRWQLGG